jgi:hypothetical protein
MEYLRKGNRMRLKVGRFCFGTRRSNALMGHYRKIDPRLWNDENFRCFDFFAQDLWLYILTKPRTNQVSLYVWRHEFALSDLLTHELPGALLAHAQLSSNLVECPFLRRARARMWCSAISRMVAEASLWLIGPYLKGLVVYATIGFSEHANHRPHC